MKKWSPYTHLYNGITITKKKSINLTPPALLFIGFIVLIVLGTLLLKLPIASYTSTTWMQALFTATSAITVTGLVVLDTGTHFTLFGQIIIAVLIQAGGLGFMTFAVVAAITLGARIGLNQQMVAQEAFNQTSIDKVIQTAKYVLLYSIIIELVGWLLLTLIWLNELGLTKALYHAFFYTISAFNNAGFALSADGLIPYAGNIGINIVITSLFIIGGIGFTVLIDLKEKKKWSSLQVNTKVVLLTTFYINLIAFFAIWLLELNNPATLANLPVSEQIMTAWFQAVTPRTAGFNTLPTAELTDGTTLLTMLLMFIGGGSLSTASGLKLGTFIVLIAATYAFLRRRDAVVLLERTIPTSQVMKSLSLTIISLVLIFIGIFILTLTEKAAFMDIVFEVVSALSTVGLSRGLTGELSSIGEVVIIFMMLAGRLGPLTLVYVLATPHKKRVSYADAKIQIG